MVVVFKQSIYFSEACSEFTAEGTKINELGSVAYYLSPTENSQVGDVPIYCASIGMEIFMPKDPEQWDSFKSFYWEELPGKIM